MVTPAAKPVAVFFHRFWRLPPHKTPLASKPVTITVK